MLETMLALKNNDLRKIPGYDPEPVEKLRKLQRALPGGASAPTLGRSRITDLQTLGTERFSPPAPCSCPWDLSASVFLA
uniref:nucleolar MIF4G domain-containing protein 1-like n=1 Tax=Panthera onca TaxID=9690 RepID=UPI002954C127|nr:nucleolar MIF4G domain-containing protein 1-like [Panthera onca]